MRKPACPGMIGPSHFGIVWALAAVRTWAAASTGKLDKDSAMAGNVTVIECSAHQHARQAAHSAGRWVSAVLACCLLLAGLLGLYEVAQMRQASSNAANPSQSIQTIRRYYAGLNEYLETGNAAEVERTIAPGALAFVPEKGAMGDDSALMTYLLALRSTYPQLRFTVDDIDAGDDIAIASVRMSGTDGARGTSQEFFRVRDGRIVQHWTTAPSSMLEHPLLATPKPVDVAHSGHLAVAEIAFSPHEEDVSAIDGPALLVVQRGRLTLIGDGASQMLDIATGATTVPGPGEPAFAEPGQAIAISANQATVRNDSGEIAVALIATLVEDHQPNPMGYPADRPLPPPAINHASMMRSPHTTAYGSATIRPLAFDDRSIPSGTWEFDVVWVVLGPGASLPLAADGEWSLVHIVSGSAHHLTPAREILTNTSDEPILALVLRLRASP
jgi:predicted SnoaL-like aldol condensation-catalyzing enzyme